MAYYSESSKKATLKYIKDKLKQINVRFPKKEYEQLIKPLIDRSGMPITTYIKVALKEKLQRDFPGEVPDNAITDTDNDQIR